MRAPKVYGELLAENSKGIKVFKKVKDNGTVIFSSFDGDKPFKTVTKYPVKTFTADRHVITSECTGHETRVENHKTGISTTIKVLKRKFFKDREYTFDGSVRKRLSENDVVLEHSAYEAKHNRLTGKGFCRIESPVYSLKRNIEFDDNGAVTGLEIHSFERLG